MAKRIKMVLYGEPGAGKSTFASKAPNPFFITTDGNYDWLGLPEKDHVQVFNWDEFRKAASAKYDGYDTIVVDLLEDVFKMKEADYCRRQGIDYVGDEGYGKGFRVTRDDFFLEIAKLLGQDKNVILIMHESINVTKDRRGIEHTKFGPSNRLPGVTVDEIEGRVRYFLRCYMKPEEFDGRIIKKRYLSVVPKENEFGIARGIDEYAIPHDIDLDFETFLNVIGFNEPVVNDRPKVVSQHREVKAVTVEEPKVEEPKVETKVEEVKQEPEHKQTVEVKEEKPEEQPEPQVQEQQMSREDRLAAIRAKLLKNKGAQ